MHYPERTRNQYQKVTSYCQKKAEPLFFSSFILLIFSENTKIAQASIEKCHLTKFSYPL